MNRKIKATLLKIELQIGLIDIADVIRWFDEQIILCHESDPDLMELTSILPQTSAQEIAETLDTLGQACDKVIIEELIQDLLVRIEIGEYEFKKVVHCMEHLELINIFVVQEKSAYFKCSMEDIESGVYGDINLLRTELIEYLKSKKLK